jgi:hypothetical protein
MSPHRRVILTGDRPTGPLHLGHYTGALANRVRRAEYERRPEEVREVLASGTARGRRVVTGVLHQALAAVGLPAASDEKMTRHAEAA